MTGHRRRRRPCVRRRLPSRPPGRRRSGGAGWSSGVLVLDGAARPTLVDRRCAQRRRRRSTTRRGPAERRVPARHRPPRPQRRRPVRRAGRGSACSSGSRPRCFTIAIGSIVGHRRRLRRPLGRRGADAAHRLVPRDPVPAARDRAGRRARPRHLEHHLRHRDHVVAVDGPARAGAGAHGEGAAVRRPRPGARRHASCTSSGVTSCRTWRR